jgi:hypothetical protein
MPIKRRNSRLTKKKLRLTKRVTKRVTKCVLKHKKRSTRRIMKGGNYQTDVTTLTYVGEPVMPLKKITATIPGFPVMSGESFLKHQEYEDFQGKDEYD